MGDTSNEYHSICFCGDIRKMSVLLGFIKGPILLNLDFFIYSLVCILLLDREKSGFSRKK